MTQLTGPPLDTTEVERALGRIGIPNRDPFRWEALNWFVTFAQRDLAVATEGDWLLLNEEAQALLHVVAHQQLAISFSREEWHELQATVRTWLTRLVDEDVVLMGRFEVQIFVRRGARTLAGPPRVRSWGGLTAMPQHNFAGQIAPGGVPGLKYHLASLLERWPDTVQRCLRCHRLFARYRGHAVFCGRKCQSQEAAQKTRDKEKQEKQETLASTTKRKRRARQKTKGARR
jgi:hypothetical protein